MNSRTALFLIVVSLCVYALLVFTYHPSSLSPDMPSTFDAGESAFALVVIGVTKCFRGLVMMRRASTVDRFGWSIIAFDLVLGGAFLFSLIISLYTHVLTSLWFGRSITTAVIVVALWQLYEVYRATRTRIHRAIGPVRPFTDDEAPPTADRRKNTEDRRLSVRSMVNELAMYKERYG